MAVKDRATIKAEAASFITDNNAQDVSGGDVRTRIEDLADSCWNLNDYGVVIISEDGEETVFKPSADTNAARGDSLEAAIAAHVENDIIQIGPGIYEVNHSLILKHGVTLLGAGKHATTIRQAWLGSAIGDPSIRAHSLIINEGFDSSVLYTAAGDIECRDFTISCRSSGIGFGHCENVRIHNVHCSEISEATENGHFFDICGVKNFLAEGLTCKAASYGFGIYQVDSAEVNTALQALDPDGVTELTVHVDFTPCQQIRFIGCQSEITGAPSDNSIHYAIHRDNHQGVLFSGCQMLGGRFALDTDDGMSGVVDVTMTGCQFTTTDTTALKPPIRIRSADTDAGPPATVRMRSLNISNNILQFAGSYGLFFRRVDDVVVSGNVIYSATTGAGYGALFYGCRGTFTGNTVSSVNDPAIATSAALFIDEPPPDNTSSQLAITGNIFVNWDRGIDNRDAAGDFVYGPNILIGVTDEVYTGAGNPELVRKVPIGFTSSGADPATTDYPADGNWGVHKNTVSGDLFIAANDGGVIKKLTLI